MPVLLVRSLCGLVLRAMLPAKLVLASVLIQIGQARAPGHLDPQIAFLCTLPFISERQDGLSNFLTGCGRDEEGLLKALIACTACRDNIFQGSNDYSGYLLCFDICNSFGNARNRWQRNLMTLLLGYHFLCRSCLAFEPACTLNLGRCEQISTSIQLLCPAS